MRAISRSDQARSLRNAVNDSKVWSSEIHLNRDNVFIEAFSANSVLVSKRLHVMFVYVDDTACSNTFSLPVITVLCRDLSNTVHAAAWGILKNRTAETFVRFFSFLRCSSRLLQHLCVTGTTPNGRRSLKFLERLPTSSIAVYMLQGILQITLDKILLLQNASGKCVTRGRLNQKQNSSRR